jgi:hypothetical protein
MEDPSEYWKVMKAVFYKKLGWIVLFPIIR